MATEKQIMTVTEASEIIANLIKNNVSFTVNSNKYEMQIDSTCDFESQKFFHQNYEHLSVIKVTTNVAETEMLLWYRITIKKEYRNEL